MIDKLNEYKLACKKAVDFQISFQNPDGGYIWDGYAVDAFHKQALSWHKNGRDIEALKLLDWAKNRLQPDGQLKEYNGDIYKHSWFFQGAHLLGRFDISFSVMKFILSCQAPCGGFPHFAGDELIRSLSTAWTGISSLYFGDMETSSKIADCTISMIEQQPRQDRFYFKMTLDGTLATEKVHPKAEFIDTTKIKQCYWEVGFPMLHLCKMYEMTGNQEYLDFAKRLFEFKLRCAKDSFSFWGSGKSALASAYYYKLSGDERAKVKAYEFCDFVLDTQRPEGGFQYEDEPDEILYYVDHAACFSIWAGESIKIFESIGDK